MFLENLIFIQKTLVEMRYSSDTNLITLFHRFQQFLPLKPIRQI